MGFKPAPLSTLKNVQIQSIRRTSKNLPNIPKKIILWINLKIAEKMSKKSMLTEFDIDGKGLTQTSAI